MSLAGITSVSGGVKGGLDSVYSDQGVYARAAQYDKLGGRYIRVSDGGQNAVDLDADTIDKTFLGVCVDKATARFESFCYIVVLILGVLFVTAAMDVFLAEVMGQHGTGAIFMGVDARRVVRVFSEYLYRSMSSFRICQVTLVMMLFVAQVTAAKDLMQYKPEMLHWVYRASIAAFLRLVEVQTTGSSYASIAFQCLVALLVTAATAVHLRARGYQTAGTFGYRSYGLYYLLVMLAPGNVLTDWIAYECITPTVRKLMSGIVVNSNAAPVQDLSSFLTRWQTAMQLPMRGVPEDVLRQVIRPVTDGQRSSTHLSRQWALYGDKLLGMMVMREAVVQRWDVGVATVTCQAITRNDALAAFLRQHATRLLTSEFDTMKSEKWGTVFEAVFALSHFYSSSSENQASYDALIFQGIPQANGFAVNRNLGCVVAV